MKTILGFLFVLLAAPTLSHAGSKSTVTLNIDTANKQAIGEVGDTRGTADSVQVIGCQVVALSSYGMCWAKNSAGTYVACSSTNAQVMAAMTLVSDASSIWFVWNAAGECVNVTVQNASFFKPKVH